MRLCDALNLPGHGCLSLVGGGGKSSLMLRLASELTAARCRVVVTTTTHISERQGEAGGFLLVGGGVEDLRDALKAHASVCIASYDTHPDKLSAPSPELLRAAPTLADWVIAEADGANRHPVKAPGPHEPPLLDEGLVVAVAGLSALGRPLEQVCHRAELAAQVLALSPKDLLTPRHLARLLTSEEGQFKGVGDPSRFRVVLNQVDNPRLLPPARETANEIQRYLPGCRVVLTALRERNCVKEVLSPCWL